MDKNTNQFSSQAENLTFADLLDAYTVIIFRAGRDGLLNTPAPVEEKQSLLDYVARLETHPMYYGDGVRPAMTGAQLLEEVKRLEARIEALEKGGT